MVDLPSDLVTRIDALVAQGHFGSRDDAILELIRLGLSMFRRRAPLPGEPPVPPGVPPPLGYEPPTDDRPIDVKPWDTKWV